MDILLHVSSPDERQSEELACKQ